MDNSSTSKFKYSGTYMLLVDLFGSVPVRKQQILKLKWEAIASELRNVAFVSLVDHCDVKLSITKVNQSNNTINTVVRCGGSLLIRTSDTLKPSVLLLRQIYGNDLVQDYEFVNSRYKDYSVKCVFGVVPIQKKNHQYVFLNGRPLLNEELLTLINYEYMKHDFGFDHLKNTGKQNSPLKIYGRPFSAHPVFLIKVECPVEVSDLLQDPAKVCHSTKHLKFITPMVIKNVRYFLEKHVTPFVKEEVRDDDENGSPAKRRKRPDPKETIFLKSTARQSDFSEKELIGKLGNGNGITSKNSLTTITQTQTQPEQHEKRLLNFDKFRDLRQKPATTKRLPPTTRRTEYIGTQNTETNINNTNNNLQTQQQLQIPQQPYTSDDCVQSNAKLLDKLIRNSS
ncbi:unnamed protein product [Ambrosiozyma monospora]|uniref:Unnamed protein product n=1 Tax=Ambrosiozyma monospora TaxID=43982 RepID=A0ACB5TAD6_AMBMO|nr:unnamed protein product [Ambrosiozyma monospora]